MELVGVREPGAGAPSAGDTLVLPAVGTANVGQMAVDLVVNTLRAEGAATPLVGWLRTRNVLPMVGNGALDGQEGEMCSNVELFRCESRGLCLLQIRAPLAEGRAAALAEELAGWAAGVGFKSVLMVGGADSASPGDQEVMAGQVRVLGAAGASEELVAALEAKGMPTLRAAGGATEAAALVNRGGLLRPLLRAAGPSLPLVCLVLFCKEGNNVPEACLMAAALSAAAEPFEKAPARWVPPRAWGFLDGPGPALELFN